MSNHLENMNLTGHPLDIIHVLNLVFLEDLDGHALIGKFMDAQFNFTKSSFSNSLIYLGKHELEKAQYGVTHNIDTY